MLLAYFGHHKCGTRWVLSILRQVSRDLGLRIGEVHNAERVGGDLGRFVRERRLDILAYTNADPDRLADLGEFRGFHVIRDPRDIVISAYFSHLYSHPVTEQWPELAAERERLRSLDREQGLLEEIALCAEEFRCLGQWPYGRPDVLELRLEDLAADPYEGFLAVFRFLDLLDEEPFRIRSRIRHLLGIALRAATGGPSPRWIALRRLPAERVLGIVHDNGFSRKSGGRRRGEEDPRSHYRKGLPGDWRNHFSPGHVAEFQTRYPGLLERLGYPTDSPGVGPESS
jgi:hypothetical protein